MWENRQIRMQIKQCEWCVQCCQIRGFPVELGLCLDQFRKRKSTIADCVFVCFFLCTCRFLGLVSKVMIFMSYVTLKAVMSLNKYCELPIESLLMFLNTNKDKNHSRVPGVAAADCDNTSSSLCSVLDAAQVQPASNNSLCYSSEARGIVMTEKG